MFLSPSIQPTMKFDTPEIAWHGKEPILSVDFSKVGSKWRLASAGADNDVKVAQCGFMIKNCCSETIPDLHPVSFPVYPKLAISFISLPSNADLVYRLQ